MRFLLDTNICIYVINRKPAHSKFIQTEVLLPRIERHGVLVVYDPQRLYHALCLSLQQDGLRVVDASHSSIESREAAMQALSEPRPPGAAVTGLLVYVPVAAPVTDEMPGWRRPGIGLRRPWA